jgi:aryl-alcohol dehydrogenase-like predicted oxidoreductase
MGLAPWGVIGQGKFMSPAQIKQRKESNEKLRGDQSENDIKISEALGKIGEEVGGSVTSVAIAWAMKKTPYVFPISKSPPPWYTLHLPLLTIPLPTCSRRTQDRASKG